MDQHDKRKLDNMLMTLGLPKLTDPDLLQRMADIISDFPGDRHDFLRDLINECDAKDRREMYDAIAPRLRFKALQLEQYELKIAEKAGNMISKRWMRVEGERPKPIQVGDSTFMPVPKALSDAAVASVRCHRCMKLEKFVAETPAGAMIKARQAGWIREPGINKECCAECTAKLASVEAVLLPGGTTLDVRDKRRVN